MTPSLRWPLSCGVALSVLLLAGCNDFQDASRHDADMMAAAASQHVPDEPVVSSVEQPLIVGDPIAEQPAESAMLERPISILIVRQTSLRDVALLVSGQTGIPVDVEADTETGGTGFAGTTQAVFDGSHLPPPPAAMVQPAMARAETSSFSSGPWLKYSGTRQGLFDAIATRFGIYERYENGRLIFFSTETKTFTIPALFFQTSNKSQIAATTGASTGSGGSSGGGSSGSSSSGSSNGQTTISLESEDDPWRNLQKTAEVISAGASVITDPQLGTVTVTGSPGQVARISTWVDNLSQTLLKQVAITIHIYSIKTNHEQNYSWSPTVALQNYGKVYGLALAPAAAPLLQGTSTPFSFGASILNSATGAAGQFSGSQAVVSALATLGTVSESYEQSAVTTNGQPAPFQRGTQTGYLQSASSVLATNAGVSNSLQPGTVTSGFTGMLTPRIANGKVLLRMDLDLQTLLSIQTITSGSSSIQVPTTANTTLHQSAVLSPGSTLVLSGYADDSSQTTHNGVGSASNWLLGGGGDAQLQKQLIVITVEARIL